MKKVVSLILCVLMLMSMMTFAGATGSLDGLTVEDLTTQAPKAITTKLTLPETFNESAITWASSNPNVIAADGTVTRPVEDTDVTLTASLTSDPSVTKAINLTVAGLGTKVVVSDNKGATSSWVPDSSGPATVATATESDGNTYTEISSPGTSTYLRAKYTIDSTKQPSGNAVFKTRVFLDKVSTAKDDARRLRFFTDVSGTSTAAAEVLFAWTSANRVSFKNGSTDNANSASMDDTCFNVDSTTGNVAWFDLTVSFDFVNNQYTTTIETEGKTSKIEKTNTLCGTHTSTSKLQSIALQYRDDAGKTSSYTRLDDMVITTSGIDGATAAERLDVYKAIVQNKINSLVDSRFVVDNINLASIPTFDGYTINWASNDESVLKVIDNVATIQGFKEIGRPVTLTATLTHEDETATVPFDVIVHPVGTTSQYNGTAKILDFEDCTANAGLSEEYKSGAGSWLVSNAGDKVVYDNVQESNVLETTGRFRYMPGRWVSGLAKDSIFRTASADLYIEKPEGYEGERFDISIALGSAYNDTYIRYFYFLNEDGSMSDSSYTNISDGSDTRVIHSAPPLGEWFNIKIVINNISDTYDVYYNDERVNDTALKISASAAENNLQWINHFDVTDATTGVTSTKRVDNVYVTYSNNEVWTKVHADLALANADDWSNLLTTGTNGSAITWTLESDDATLTDGDGVKVFTPNEGFGKGTAVLTATSGNQSRTYTLNFDLINPVQIKGITYANDATEFAAGVTIDSVTVSTEETSAKGYVAIFDGSRLDTIKTFDITAGDKDYDINLTVGANLSNPKLKIFAWSDILKPLSNVFAK